MHIAALMKQLMMLTIVLGPNVAAMPLDATQNQPMFSSLGKIEIIPDLLNFDDIPVDS